MVHDLVTCLRSSFARAPLPVMTCDSSFRELRLALVSRLVSRLGSSKLWLCHPVFEANRKIDRKLLKRHLIVVLGLTLHVNRCSLARATRHFSSKATSASRKRTEFSNKISIRQRNKKIKKTPLEPLAWQFVHFFVHILA